MYASREDMTGRFGEKEVRELTDLDGEGAIDDAVLGYGLRAASDEIDGYIAGRYTLPLAVCPPVLTGIACDIARYRLTGTDRPCTEEIRDRYRDGIRYLEKVASGSVSLGAAVSGGAAVPSSSVGVMFMAGGNNWSRQRTRGGGY
jgi:phage gp36-like protein